MSKKPSSRAGADKPFEIPPPPATGGTHVWSDTLGIWQTVDETIQPWDERHPDNAGRAPTEPAEQPLKDA